MLNVPWRNPWELLYIVPCAVVANVLYLAGPAVDSYIRWLGYRESWPRMAMFTVGTAFSALLAIVILVEIL